jgi:DNA (cytosine-5)-methyltransferase 1
MKPKALDLFCGAGGASMGLHLAGYDVTGIDINPQPNYPFKFIQGDALEADLASYDLIWASPPCQAYSPLNAYNKKQYPDLVAQTRTKLKASGTPYIIENVVQAPLVNPIILCGSMFGLPIYRHRAFETSFPVIAPEHPKHVHRCQRNGYLPTTERPFMTITGGRHSKAWTVAAAKALGSMWMKETKEICESIPPVYSEYLARVARSAGK